MKICIASKQIFAALKLTHSLSVKLSKMTEEIAGMQAAMQLFKIIIIKKEFMNVILSNSNLRNDKSCRFTISYFCIFSSFFNLFTKNEGKVSSES